MVAFESLEPKKTERFRSFVCRPQMTRNRWKQIKGWHPGHKRYHRTRVHRNGGIKPQPGNQIYKLNLIDPSPHFFVDPQLRTRIGSSYDFAIEKQTRRRTRKHSPETTSWGQARSLGWNGWKPTDQTGSTTPNPTRLYKCATPTTPAKSALRN